MEPTHRDFHHPYQPYQIQYELMNAIYDCIADRKVGIFESPTGTGKSLSLICSSLTWLRDFQEQGLHQQVNPVENEEELDWVLEHLQREKQRAIIEQKQQQEAKLRRIRARELRQRQSYEGQGPRAKRIKTDNDSVAPNSEDEDRFVLADYDSDNDKEDRRSLPGAANGEYISAANLALMEKLGEFVGPVVEDLEPVDEVKIFYCSRTHSQLTQFINELRRIKLPATSWAVDLENPDNPMEPEQEQIVIKHVPLASRKNLCINPTVAKLGNASAINERCLELQQPETAKEHKCPFVPNKEKETLVNDFRDHTLAKIRDIEDIGTIGKAIGVCPYYASRTAIRPSEIVTLPYPLLLQKSAREALGISLKDHVLIIDEAHNLMDAISNLYSIGITQSQLKRSKALLNVYLQKFRNRLKGKNRIYVVQVARVIDSLLLFLDQKAANSQLAETIVQISDLMAGKGVDQVNLHKLMRYLGESKLARKVEGYITYLDKQDSGPGSRSQARTAPVLTAVQSFFGALTNPASEGRFFYERTDSGDIMLKYMLLDPSAHFREAVEEARSVILAGGTMSPMDDYARHLFPYVDPERLITWSCGHIIPKENLIVVPITKGPNKVEFDFTYQRRNVPAVIDALGHAIATLCTTIPDGVVIFFPSYRYLDEVMLRWKKIIPSIDNIWTQITKRKPIFMESKDDSGVNDVLQEYTKSIEAGKGGLLLSVIGGKMSEGINFSDKLGRGVVVVGLPFPNIQSAQWKAKLEYIENSTVSRGGTRDEGKAAARGFYENACMRAVNQSIGRAIRHQKDYASIVLLDRRYRTPRIECKLPGWIKQGLVASKGERSFDDIVVDLEGFFKSKKAL